MVYIILIAITIGFILYLLNSGVHAENRNKNMNNQLYYNEEFSEEEGINDLTEEEKNDREGL